MKILKILKYFTIATILAGVTWSAYADWLTFPMTVWWTLKSWTGNVLSWATVSFYSQTGWLLWSLVTTKDWQYGWNTAFDQNVALSEFTGALTIKVTANSKNFTLTGWNLTSIDAWCPVETNITFTSKSCEYDINLNDSTLYAVTSGGWSSGGSGWGSGGSGGGWGSSYYPVSTTTTPLITVSNIIAIVNKTQQINQNIIIGITWIVNWNAFNYVLTDSKSVLGILSSNSNIAVQLMPGTTVIGNKSWNKTINQPREVANAATKRLWAIALTVWSSSKNNMIKLNKPAILSYKVDTTTIKDWTKYNIYINNNWIFKKSWTVMVKKWIISIYIDTLTNIVLLKTK